MLKHAEGLVPREFNEGSPNNKTTSANMATAGGTPRLANETRMKNEAVNYYMRIR